ncbi:hypothetical protein K1T71_010758 [Dendrolimus kikuchii]|uniref:Uncharacterized protein n=1 Tax=Dendrolimus kikuchii TaxID=765133 RepID=A0ACC1CPR8_9NEOP|nr:hypothetical protein K1T71_010758 [Dendrolimus kikuchii]
MSIPPLVCSTPPPPDQCEEDKDPEDFDIRYNLSQEDEDETNDYDYDSFSTYNHLQNQHSSDNIENIPVVNDNDTGTGKDHAQSISHSLIESPSMIKIDQNKETNTEQLNNIISETCENSLKSDEDNNIEDLDLKLDESTKISNKPIIVEDDDFNISVKDQTVIIPTTDNVVDKQNINICILDQHEAEVKTLCSDKIELVEEDIPEFLSINTTIDGNDEINYPQSDLSHTELNKPNVELETLPDYDFEDFDDFQFSRPEIDSNIVIDNCDNPWDKRIDEDTEFSDFTANFDHIANNEVEQIATGVFSNTLAYNVEEHLQEQVSQNVDDDDDFGDFDDFKSSNVKATNLNISSEDQIDIYDQVPVLNLEVSDKGHQILDSVNQVLNSIFPEDIIEPDSEFECKLDSLLSETWGHLMETDVRQPYIINWNNSLGQKTLLRALSIDSRNILFGPKWSHNMPKYAVTLSSAPLQPQKPILQSSMSQNETSSMESVSSKMGNWTDPFTSDGQESCNTENEVTSKKRKPINIEVFESASSKPESLYPSNISVQPLRQISLPDTHIFTPTDSETPRSKTIHYNTGPTVLLPEQHSNNTHTFQSDNSISKPESNNYEDDDYWEFQDFKCTPNLNTVLDASVTAAPAVTADSDNQNKLNKTYQGELLQPIKINPVVPKLNWPNPGEVKEVFDDFSDFVSNSSCSKDTFGQITNNGIAVECNSVANANDKVANTHINETEVAQCNIPVNFEDEFDTFQYALPTQNTSKILLDQKSNFEEAFSKLNFNLSDNISSTNPPKHGVALTKHMFSMSNTAESSNKHSLTFQSQSQSNILQPTPSNSNSQTQQKTGQILQPLSLESYSQLNWPSPGIDLQDLSKFNPVESLHSLKSDLSNSASNKSSSPIHNQKNSANNQAADDEVWGEFVSSKPKPQQSSQKKNHNFGDDDEWTDFVSSPSVKPQNGLNTISFNVHTNSNIQKSMYQNKLSKNKQTSIDIPTLNYITPKTNNPKSCNDRHFQNL